MKCITQLPVVPIDAPPSSSHLARAIPWKGRARVVQRNPRNAPMQDIT